MIGRNSRDHNVIVRALETDPKDLICKDRLTVEMLKKIAIDTNRSPENRKIVVLTILMDSIIAPTPNGHWISPSFVQYLENLGEDKKYEYGAALLAFLCILGYRNINKVRARSMRTCGSFL